MSGVDTRNLSRDSLFLMAQVRHGDSPTSSRVKVRNLSSGGMMAEGDASVVRGANVSVELKNIGWVEGVVAWVQDERFGIAFAKEIDPQVARSKVGGGESVAPRYTRTGVTGIYDDPSRLRNI
ncbi:PilZ domain-containing protein [Pontixanthobacter aquaemixtae]|uniref:PilZ domain-containing protein n=1 Tax=Pontixanthobacter aquaemixtae TaxID=1958940 RepID=A0A844ZVJ9_9SPHN|nr:PilZ domain-containing protein [Pontixanthobacter aquaemixtae]MXO91200.1 PilZ domain-containing protein [Pontixanthobacter aquaemixtae]